MPDIAAIGLQIDAKQFGDHIPTRSYILTGKVDIEIPRTTTLKPVSTQGYGTGHLNLAEPTIPHGSTGILQPIPSMVRADLSNICDFLLHNSRIANKE